MDRYVNINIDKFWNNRPHIEKPEDKSADYIGGWDNCMYAFSSVLRKMLNENSNDILIQKTDILRDLWNIRVHAVEIYHKYRNKADNRFLRADKRNFYQGRAEGIWEIISIVDALYERYKRGN